MNKDLISVRKSVRTFDGRTLNEADREALTRFIEEAENPFSVPVTFRILNAKEHGLNSPGIGGHYAFEDPGIATPENTHYIVSFVTGA